MSSDSKPAAAVPSRLPLSPGRSAALTFLPILAWGALLGALSNGMTEGAILTPIILLAAFAGGLLLLKPLVIGLGVVAITRWLWGLWRRRRPDDRWEAGGARAIGLLYVPIYGTLAMLVGLWDGWSTGGLGPFAAALLYGMAGGLHALAVHRHTVISAAGLLVALAAEGEDPGAAAEPRRPREVRGGPAGDAGTG